MDRDHNHNNVDVDDLVNNGIVTDIQSSGAIISFHDGQQQGLLHKNHISAIDWKLVPIPTNDGYTIIDACFRDEKCGETNDIFY